MKKLFTVLLLALSLQAFSTSVTFMLKMSGQDLPLDSVYIVGDFTDWLFIPLLDLGDSLYTWSTDLEPGPDSLGYYFITVNSWDSAGNQDWNYYKRYREWFDTLCAERVTLMWGSDRLLIVPEEDAIIDCYFAKCPDYSPPTNISDHSAGEFRFEIYPNPSAGDLTLIVPESRYLVSVNVIDISGKVINVDKSFLSATEVRLKTGERPRGVYFIKVYNKEFSLIRKLIIK